MTDQHGIERGLSYDDVLVQPGHSHVSSRENVNLRTRLAGSVELETPIVSAPMDTITGPELASALAEMGGVGIIHRFQSVDEQVSEVNSVSGQVGGAVGITTGWEQRARALVDAGVDFLCVDTAFGYQEQCLNTVEELAELFPDTPLVAGNVATEGGVLALGRAGADAVRVGIGPGSHCKTREVAGVGVPQITAIQNAARAKARLHGKTARPEAAVNNNFRIIADGGIRKSGDIVKAIVAGADSVMIGGMFGRCAEAAGESHERSLSDDFRETRGMASDAARDDAEGVSNGSEEGVVQMTTIDTTVESLVTKLREGVQSGISYTGAKRLIEASQRGSLIQASAGAQNLNQPQKDYQ